MAKRVIAVVRLQAPAGQATPAPPVGMALGPHGISLPEFCKQFNAQTRNEPPGMAIPTLVTVFHDRTFSFITKSPPASILLKQAAGLAKGSGEPNRSHVGSVKRKDVLEIAKRKINDLNTDDMDQAVRIIEGTAHAMGITVEGE
jgi:large subunit ribosomal protein L11